MVLPTVLPWAERPVSDASDPELLITHIEKLAADLRPVKGEGGGCLLAWELGGGARLYAG
jgi:hypothetical protein